MNTKPKKTIDLILRLDADIPESFLLNVLSGYETTYFYRALFLCGHSTCDIITIYSTLFNLAERGETDLIYAFIKSKYIEAEIPFPGFFDELRAKDDLFREFMYELLADLEELIVDEFFG